MAGIKPGWPPERHAATPSFATHTNAFINKLGWREKKHINKKYDGRQQDKQRGHD